MFKYTITEKTQNPVSKKKYMDPGIHENVELVDVAFKETEHSKFLSFEFVNAENAILKHTEWRVKIPDDINSLPPAKVKMYSSIIGRQTERINRIAAVFVDSKTLLGIEEKNFEDFAKTIVKVMGDSYKGKKIRIKVVLDNKNYLALPNYTDREWIESMDIPKEESKISIIPSRDKLTREAPKKVEGANEVVNEIEKASNIDESKDDLPF